MADRRTERWLTLISLVLALGCAGLAWAWTLKADEAACWRQALADDETVAAADCAP